MHAYFLARILQYEARRWLTAFWETEENLSIEDIIACLYTPYKNKSIEMKNKMPHGNKVNRDFFIVQFKSKLDL